MSNVVIATSVCVILWHAALANDLAAANTNTRIQNARFEHIDPNIQEVKLAVQRITTSAPNTQVDDIFAIYRHALNGSRRVRRAAVDALGVIKDMPRHHESQIACDMLVLLDTLEPLNQPMIEVLGNKSGNTTSLRIQCNVAPLEPAMQKLDLTNLQALTIFNVVEREDLRVLQKCPQLESLTIHSSLIEDSDLDEVKQLSNLKCLRFWRCDRLTSSSIIGHKALPSLSELQISGKQAGNINALYEARNVETLRIEATQLLDEGLRSIGSSGLSKLKSLTLENAVQISDASIDALGELTALDELCILSSQITDTGLERLIAFNLRSLNLAGSRITKVRISDDHEDLRLESISLTGTQVGDDSIEPLCRLPNLRELWLGNTRITDAGAEKLLTSRRLSRVGLSRHTSINRTTIQKTLLDMQCHCPVSSTR